jgi:hypothetical protein
MLADRSSLSHDTLLEMHPNDVREVMMIQNKDHFYGHLYMTFLHFNTFMHHNIHTCFLSGGAASHTQRGRVFPILIYRACFVDALGFPGADLHQ